MVLLLLGLAALPRDPIEAARMDGATPFQIFTHITLPLLAPTILIVVILSVLAGFTAFDHIWVMAQSYAGKRQWSLTVYMFYEGFSNNAWGFASAIAVVLGLIVLVITWALSAVLTQGAEVRSVMSTLQVFQGGYALTSPTVVLTASLVASLPTVVLLLALRKTFMRGTASRGASPDLRRNSCPRSGAGSGCDAASSAGGAAQGGPDQQGQPDMVHVIAVQTA